MERERTDWDRIVEEMWQEEPQIQESMPPPRLARIIPNTFAGLNPGNIVDLPSYGTFLKGMAIHEEMEKGMTNPTQTKSEVSNMKFEDITQGLPIVGLRVMINPEKFEEFPRSLHGMSGTIINVQGSRSGCQNIIRAYKDQGHINNKSWNVTVKFENGKQHDIQVRKLIPINNNHQDIHHIYTNHDDRERYLFDAEYEDYITKRVIMNGEKIIHDKLYNDEYRRKIFDEA